MRAALLCLLVLAFEVAPAAYAGRSELTTYYPAPYGEYQDLEANHSLKMPVKNVDASSPVVAGEIWVQDDSLPAAT